ncbi:unnamed protein product [Alopecurus aequalis]
MMKIEVVESTLVAPSEATPRLGLWLSNLDLIMPETHTPVVYYYPAPTNGAAAKDSEACPSPPSHDRTGLRERSPLRADSDHRVYLPGAPNRGPVATRVYSVSRQSSSPASSPSARPECPPTASSPRTSGAASAPHAASRRAPTPACSPSKAAAPAAVSGRVGSDLWVVSWLGMPMYDADFGWGLPRFVFPAEMLFGGMALVTQCADRDDGIAVLLALEPENLQRFEDAFYGEY